VEVSLDRDLFDDRRIGSIAMRASMFGDRSIDRTRDLLRLLSSIYALAERRQDEPSFDLQGL
jgi:hypothetical protein